MNSARPLKAGTGLNADMVVRSLTTQPCAAYAQ
jgi:hypothetical protein